jgi:hypothetical protein
MLTRPPQSVSRLFRKCGILNISQSYRSSRPVNKDNFFFYTDMSCPVIEVSSSRGPNRVGVFPPDMRMKTDPVSKTLRSLVFVEYRTMDKVQKRNHIASSELFGFYYDTSHVHYYRWKSIRTVPVQEQHYASCNSSFLRRFNFAIDSLELVDIYGVNIGFTSFICLQTCQVL